ncbi:hypothetical protein [Photorhabdus sp. CRCIA-P01]|uniref:hypothetical protein n=1 Tax=Photorhabdus sp. CRCIA-P01 TaxID=2019570 RepID=UPI000E59CEC4|nr:hypothetical protein [Photorhabdus sp. CRCIA-P01]
MTRISSLNELKEALVRLARICNIPKRELYDEGNTDYTLNLDEELNLSINRLLDDFSLLQKALDQEDMIAVQAALNRARANSMDLSNFFENICEDIEMIGWTDRYNWPKTPKDYEIPDHYNYPENQK